MLPQNSNSQLRSKRSPIKLPPVFQTKSFHMTQHAPISELKCSQVFSRRMYKSYIQKSFHNSSLSIQTQTAVCFINSTNRYFYVSCYFFLFKIVLNRILCQHNKNLPNCITQVAVQEQWPCTPTGTRWHVKTVCDHNGQEAYQLPGGYLCYAWTLFGRLQDWQWHLQQPLECYQHWPFWFSTCIIVNEGKVPIFGLCSLFSLTTSVDQ